jgi:UDP-GlcNAc:undecaprenyl-phosphate GlcNAc-1-phosphate transferase
MDIYLLVLIIIILFSLAYFKLATKYRIFDIPNKRSSHLNKTITAGGILFTLSIVLFSVLNNFQYLYFCVEILIVSIISFLDDVYNIPIPFRILSQVLAISLAFLELEIHFYYFFPFLLIAFFIINTFNFMDGVNGMTAMYSLFSLAGIFALNNSEKAIDQDLLLYIALAMLVFSCYNFRKRALLFAGDIGSIVMGLLIVFLLYKLVFAVNSLLVLLFVLLYVIDAGLTLGHRFFYTKESVFVAHREHLYEKLVRAKQLSHLQVSVTYAIMQLFVNGIVYYSYTLPMYSQIIIFIFLTSIFLSIYIFIFRRLKNKLK